MVQIIPRAQGGLEQFLEAMGPATRGIAEGISEIKGGMNARKERQTLAERFGKELKTIRNPDIQKMLLAGGISEEKTKAEKSQKLSALEDIKKSKYWENASDLEKAVIEREILGEISAQTAKSLINLQREKEASQKFADAILSLNANQEPQMPAESQKDLGFEGKQDFNDQSMEPTINQFAPENKSSVPNYEAKIKQLQNVLPFAKTPEQRATLESQIRELQTQREMNFKMGKEKIHGRDLLRQETLPIRKEIAEKASAAAQGIQNKEQLMKVIDTGNIDDPTFAIVAQALPFRLGERMLSPESVVYRAGIIDEYKDLRTIFQGQTRMKEIDLLEDKIASLYLTDEQKKAILKSRIEALNADVIKGEVAAELEAEGDFGGALQFQKKVNERAKPKLEALFNRILDQQKSILQDAENKKQIKLNANNPEDIALVKQMIDEAGGDRQKARKLAKQKGYSWDA